MSDFLTNLFIDSEFLAVEKNLFVQCVQSRMAALYDKWYPDKSPAERQQIANKKIGQEWHELGCVETEDEAKAEMIDVQLSIVSLFSQKGWDNAAEMEAKLQILEARTDQAERDRQRGIG